MQTTVYVDRACDILYSSYYIYGLKKIFGKVIFSGKYFSQFKHNNTFVPVVVKTGKNLTKLVFDFGDSYVIDEAAMDWCDAYGKININPEKTDLSKYPKLVSVGPGFAIRLYSKAGTALRAVFNYLLTNKRVPDKRRFFADYYAQMNRQYLSYYQKKETTGDYIFFAGALWKKEEQTNQYRANYIRACKNVDGVKFEGGFAPRSRNDIPGYDDLTMEEKVPMSDYLTKIKDSAVVFNTPVILDCHGWKLGEFMALGKAMIATPIKNLLPVPLEHGKNVHFINGNENEVFDAVKKLTSDHSYRHQIENNIKEYFNAHVTPERSVEIVCEKAGVSSGK